MKYKVGSLISCNVATDGKGVRKIINRAPKKDENVVKEKFKVIWIDENDRCYVVAIPPEMIGWGISEWHLIHWEIEKSYLKMKHFCIPFEGEDNGS